jgi:hypothetical protein
MKQEAVAIRTMALLPYGGVICLYEEEEEESKGKERREELIAFGLSPFLSLCLSGVTMTQFQQKHHRAKAERVQVVPLRLYTHTAKHNDTLIIIISSCVADCTLVCFG